MNAVARKLGQASTKAINDRLEVAREERQKREEIMERRKAKAMAAKWRRAIKRISLSSEKDDESDIKDDTDPDQTDLD